jgi:hypothetical protein
MPVLYAPTNPKIPPLTSRQGAGSPFSALFLSVTSFLPLSDRTFAPHAHHSRKAFSLQSFGAG